jgi:hypothetical protein
VKYTDGDNPVMLTRTLTQLEMRALDRYPEIQNRPRDALAALGTAILSMDDDMDSESARKAIES